MVVWLFSLVLPFLLRRVTKCMQFLFPIDWVSYIQHGNISLKVNSFVSHGQKIEIICFSSADLPSCFSYRFFLICKILSLICSVVVVILTCYSNNGGWMNLFKNPVVMYHSLEKRIIRRCSIVEVLLWKDWETKLKVWVCLLCWTVDTGKNVLERFVARYIDEVRN